MLSVGIGPKDSIAVLRRESSAASKAVRFLASAHGRASVRRLTLLYRLPTACLLARWSVCGQSRRYAHGQIRIAGT